MKKIVSLIGALLLTAMLCLPLFGAVETPAASYVFGDVDGDGDITILDVTTIQRILAHMTTDSTGAYTLRGDVDGDGELTSNDVTWLKRHLAHMTVPYPIGDVVEAPTEPETTAPTQKPKSTDPYELPPR